MCTHTQQRPETRVIIFWATYTRRIAVNIFRRLFAARAHVLHIIITVVVVFVVIIVLQYTGRLTGTLRIHLARTWCIIHGRLP